jgi:hypothetical protein
MPPRKLTPAEQSSAAIAGALFALVRDLPPVAAASGVTLRRLTIGRLRVTLAEVCGLTALGAFLFPLRSRSST